MGATSSRSTFARAEDEVFSGPSGWEDYTSGSGSAWRSARVKELDNFGGACRPAIASGKSFTAKMQYLELHLQNNRSQMEALVTVASPNRTAVTAKAARVRQFMLNTDRRAAERKVADGGGVDDGVEIEYVSPFDDSVATLPPHRGRGSSARRGALAGAADGAPSAAVAAAVAEWRRRVHEARRRTLLTVRVALLLKRRHRHPARIPRLDDMAFVVPGLLGDDAARFVREFRKFRGIKDEIASLEAQLQEAVSDTEDGSPKGPTKPHGSRFSAPSDPGLASAPSWPARGEAATTVITATPRGFAVAELPAAPAAGAAGYVVAGCLSPQTSLLPPAAASPARGSAPPPHSSRPPLSPAGSLRAAAKRSLSNRPDRSSGGGGGPASPSVLAHGGGGSGHYDHDDHEGALAGMTLNSRRRSPGRPHPPPGAVPLPPFPGAGTASPGAAAAASPSRNTLAKLASMGAAHAGGSGMLPGSGGGGSPLALRRRGYTHDGVLSPVAANDNGPADGAALQQGGDHAASPYMRPPSPARASGAGGRAPSARPRPQPPPGGSSSPGRGGLGERAAPRGAPASDAPAPSAAAASPSSGPAMGRRVASDVQMAGLGTVHEARSSPARPLGLAGQVQQRLRRSATADSHMWASPSPTRSRTASGSLSEAGTGGDTGSPTRLLSSRRMTLSNGGGVTASPTAPEPPRARWNAVTARPSTGLGSGPGRRASLPGQLQIPPPGALVLFSRMAGSPNVATNRPTKSQFRDALASQRELLAASTKLLSMYINRTNSAWAEKQAWEPPCVVRALEERAWAGSDSAESYKADVMRKLRSGAIAVQLLAGADYMPMPGGRPPVSLWSSDPWALVEAVRPGMMPQDVDRIEGVGIGGRALCALVQQVRSLAGTAALSKLNIVLNLNADQELDVLQELRLRNFYGLNRDNFVIVVAERHPGFAWDDADALFVRDEGVGAARHAQGTGFSMAQMAWPGEAFTLDKAGQKVTLDAPALETLEARGVDWVVSRRCRDLSILLPGGLLDVAGLAHRLALRHAVMQRGRAGAALGLVMDVAMVASGTAARQYGSVALHHANRDNADGGPRMASQVTELLLSDLSSPSLMDRLEAVCARDGGRLAVGLGRYMYSVRTMKSVGTSRG
ncbi:hypothetical protein FOA52_006927 [Chlamydomonas sp. UWO 241]|nr:hypothetical protein FOA52_006927 [Chlamydomonas sp. UWO 241]